MAGETPFRKRRPWRRRGPETSQDGTGGTGPAEGGDASAERSAAPPDHSGGFDDERGRSASLEVAGAASPDRPAEQEQGQAEPTTGGRLHAVKRGARKGRESAKALAAQLADRIIDTAPRVPVRDLATLRKQFPGLGPEELADKLVTGACRATATVGAGIGAAAMMPVPPAMIAELAAEVTGVAAIEMKLVAELHEVYGRRPPGNLGQRSTAYLTSWTEERGIDITRPTTLNAALGGQMKRELRQQIMKRMARNLPNLIPFMIGAAVGATMNRRDTRKLADRVRSDLRKDRIAWDRLPELPPLEQPANPAELPKEIEGP
ncbi:hypothetical protein ACIQUZ_08620 [Streptomyces griseus]|uniref:Uncharacterized protein n=1 Tax=Streptomyces griseus subsp. griseus (strain JCM 4626 / CBS 651.72 / NBRC 13350 / KCC S-0626 / ISP 5235) TaxID=455632 RepID=B1VXN0_STRGG|nr:MULTISPECIES: hypothetical protein [Streptomyces]MYR10435.1 hypothetical protein [Streptomyces sp. SID724]MBW3704139.1 hypothetical protein [Streptomyces griseus]NEB54084.1 hypothetical protein [Streptomyces griseus]SCE37637.1 hypothetical protein GA0115261_1048610 [Streptomyces sp. OspMP-M43]SED47604.1 hypothetical protein SAMN04490359_0590 [Streptomyces griseus]